ncbi:hypothetical protein LP419_38935 [Massilia sp. H-1]|nr:hypothetical protein LP419_38935 [Massilia sp. H-1]
MVRDRLPDHLRPPQERSLGADFDRQITDIVDAAGVPFVFGTYDSDSSGEYNAAAFVQPGTGLLGFYRKTRLFPLTEYLLRPGSMCLRYGACCHGAAPGAPAMARACSP